MRTQEHIRINQAESEDFAKIEEYRQTLTIEQQADYVKSIYPYLSEESKRMYFMLFVKSWRWQREHSFIVINGGNGRNKT